MQPQCNIAFCAAILDGDCVMVQSRSGQAPTVLEGEVDVDYLMCYQNELQKVQDTVKSRHTIVSMNSCAGNESKQQKLSDLFNELLENQDFKKYLGVLQIYIDNITPQLFKTSFDKYVQQNKHNIQNIIEQEYKSKIMQQKEYLKQKYQLQLNRELQQLRILIKNLQCFLMEKK